MSKKRFRVRDKLVQKMTRDGLVEQNQSTGTQQRVSQRLTDISLDRSKSAAQPARGGGRTRNSNPSIKRRSGFQGKQKAESIPDSIQEENAAQATTLRGPNDGPVRTPTVAGRGRRRLTVAREGRGASFPPAGNPTKGTRQRGYSVEQKRIGGISPEGLSEINSNEAPDGGRLHFDDGTPEIPERGEKAGRKRTGSNKSGSMAASNAGKLKFARNEASPNDTISVESVKTPKEQPLEDKKRKAASRLLYEKSELPVEQRVPSANPKEAVQPASQVEDHSSNGKRLDKLQKKSDRIGAKLEKAKANLPTKRRIALERQFDNESGKVRHRLTVEKIPKPHDGIVKRAVQATGRTAYMTVSAKTHLKIREVEKENVAVEAMNKGTATVETVAGMTTRLIHSRHNRSYRRVAKLERKSAKANVKFLYKKALQEHPELKGRVLAKWIQKRQIKRRYAKAAREAKKELQTVVRAAGFTAKAARALAQAIATHGTVIGVVIGLILVVLLFSAGLSSCGAMLSGIQGAILGTCYVADEPEINNSDLYYSEKETELQDTINNIESDHPHYDEYNYNIGEIGHNAYELMSYLSAAFDAFTFAEVQAELDSLFNEQYHLEIEEEIETRYDEDDEPYDWYILNVTLTVRPLAEIIAGRLPSGDPTDRYEVYMQTYGNRQTFGNPFNFPWLGYVTCPYGWRIHPITGEKNLHRGIDIGVASGTPIQAIQDGTVVSAGNNGDYGLCVVIEDGEGYRSKYAHCSSIAVNAGQQVKRGDVIAAVGSTGVSTGPHVHVELIHNGEYLNPYYFMDNGSEGGIFGGGGKPGTPGGPEIPDNPGEPIGNSSFDALIEEAEKYLGYPYVWGGSTPNPGFDCGGFVCWVYNHSGVYSMPRLGAQSIFNITTPVTAENAKPGDLIFFQGTYSSPYPVSHVGIYVGGGKMIHCGDPVSYERIDTPYWQKHFYAFGRFG